MESSVSGSSSSHLLRASHPHDLPAGSAALQAIFGFCCLHLPLALSLFWLSWPLGIWWLFVVLLIPPRTALEFGFRTDAYINHISLVQMGFGQDQFTVGMWECWGRPAAALAISARLVGRPPPPKGFARKDCLVWIQCFLSIAPYAFKPRGLASTITLGFNLGDLRQTGKDHELWRY